MKKIIILGNSGAGKSTLAAKLSRGNDMAHLDLDTLAWLPDLPPQRRPVEESTKEIDVFLAGKGSWVIEGCYTDLLEVVKPFATEVIFLNLPVDLCQLNAQRRPWEPHKYESKEAQDKNLPMLLEWISQYYERSDTFSYSAHRVFFDSFSGSRKEYTSNERNN